MCLRQTTSRGALGSVMDEDTCVERMFAAARDQFEERNVSDEVLYAFDQQEDRANTHQSKIRDITAPALTKTNGAECLLRCRHIGLVFLEMIIKDSGAFESAGAFGVWCEVVRILDADSEWLFKAGPSVTPSAILTRACAAIFLVANDNLLPSLAHQASFQSRSLGGIDVKESDIEREQRRLFMCTPTVPSGATWMSIFISRLHVIFGASVESVIEQVHGAAVDLMCRSLIVSAGFDSLSTQKHAVGAICLALLSVGALNANVFAEGAHASDMKAKRAALRVVFCLTLEHIKASASDMALDLHLDGFR